MFCISGFIRLDGIGEKPCAEHTCDLFLSSNRDMEICNFWLGDAGFR